MGSVKLVANSEEAANASSEELGTTKQLSPYDILHQLEESVIPKFPNANITTEVLGRTEQFNDIVLIKATSKQNDKTFRAETKFSDDAPEKKIIFIVHSLSTFGYNSLWCMFYLPYVNKLLSYYMDHLEQFDIFVIPMANPDGAAKAANDAIWNKNVSPQGSCPGVALDRNFDVAWNESNQKISSCSSLYPGEAPFSEPETQAVRDVFHKYSHKIIGYFHVHPSTCSAEFFKGDAVLYPKGYTDKNVDDDKYIDLKGEIDETLRNASFKVFSVNTDTLFNWYGKVAGTSVDYASTVYGIPFAMELAMQAYSGRVTHGAILNAVWKPIINVIFNTMYKTVERLYEDQKQESDKDHA